MTHGFDRALKLSVSLGPSVGPRVSLEGDTKRAVALARRRLALAAALFGFAFALLGARVVEIAVSGGAAPMARADAGATHAASRADIVDRNGVLLATNLPTAALYARPSRMLDVDEAASALARALPRFDAGAVRAKLTAGRDFVWLERDMSPAQVAAVHGLGVPGLEFVDVERRVYPQGSLLAHVLGYTDVDNRGIAGLERVLDAALRARADANQGPLALSLDVRAQQILHEELSKSVAEFDAIGATGLVMDPATGEVLALVSLPDFDPNRPAEATDEQRFNRATLGVYEMGSIFKVFTTAMALDYGVADLSSAYDATNPIRVARYTISDSHPKARWLSVPEVFIYSSNIGAAKMALDVGAERQRAFLKKLGLLAPPPFDLPELGAPMVPASWGEITTMTVGFGHGIAVSPLQTASAFAATVNGGVLVPPTLLKRSPAEIQGTRVMDAATSDAMRALLRLVVVEGTGRSADVPGYGVGGKTGTAEKASVAGYRRDALLSSFIAAFPMERPRFVILVTIDEPKGTAATFGYATGGWTAAPAIARIVGRLAPLYGLEPEAPDATDAVLAGAPGLESTLASLATR